MADISKLEEQANLLMQNVNGWETSRAMYFEGVAYDCFPFGGLTFKPSFFYA